MNRITTDWAYRREIVLIYDDRLKWGRKQTKRLDELLFRIAVRQECEVDQTSVVVHSLHVTPHDGKVMTYGTIRQDFESLHELANSFGLDENDRILSAISEDVENTRSKLRTL